MRYTSGMPRPEEEEGAPFELGVPGDNGGPPPLTDRGTGGAGVVVIPTDDTTVIIDPRKSPLDR
jgi:hypothetical protein